MTSMLSCEVALDQYAILVQGSETLNLALYAHEAFVSLTGLQCSGASQITA